MRETGCEQVRISVKPGNAPAVMDLAGRLGEVRALRSAQPMMVEHSGGGVDVCPWTRDGVAESCGGGLGSHDIGRAPLAVIGGTCLNRGEAGHDSRCKRKRGRLPGVAFGELVI